MAPRWVPLALLLVSMPAASSAASAVGAGHEFSDDELEALGLDDTCAADSDCALNALQLRGVKVASQAEHEQADSHTGPIWHYALPCYSSCGSSAGSCPQYCGAGNACCKAGDDYSSGPTECQNVGFWPVVGFHTCVNAGHAPAPAPVQPPAPLPSPPGSIPGGGIPGIPGGLPTPSPSGPYQVSWAAEGTSFFDGWDFLHNDDNHGSAEYLSQSDAVANGVVETYDSHAIMRAGKASPQYKYKRQTAKIASKKSWKYFLATMKFTHVPFGCGVWPAFFTLAPNYPWPDGGEIDILEYVNDGPSQSSFHTAQQCMLNPIAVSKYGYEKDYNRMNYNCSTHYPKYLGCAPNKWVRTGQSWANSPGVVAMEWTEDFLKLFYIPDGQYPPDLVAGSPNPDTWDRWIFSYYPFKDSGCSDTIMQAQQLVMQINFCGDWASKTWRLAHSCTHKATNCRSVDPLAEYAPQDDCCTQFIWDADGSHGTDSYLHDRAFWNITYLKVYQRR